MDPNIAQTQAIIEILDKRFGLYESKESLRHREQVLGTLHKLFQEWVARVGQKRGLTREVALQKGFKMFTFGSYRLGVQSPDADIDTLVVVPRHIDREQHFFGDLFKMLEAEEQITELTAVPKARVPVIKLVFSGVNIDLLFARTAKDSLDPNLSDLSDDHILRKCDTASVLSLNGRRVTDMILELIPPDSVEAFRVTLKCVKLWAKSRGVYSNILGYPGGVALAILVAKVCQMYPALPANLLIIQFFKTYASWNWPLPVSLVDDLQKHEDWTDFDLKVWGVGTEGKADLMPILTPAFPSGNATYNVSKSTKDIFQAEIKNSLGVLDLIRDGSEAWAALFEPYNFFRGHRHFLRIDILANSKTAFQAWSGFVESRLRFLILNLQSLPGLLIRPWIRAYHVTDSFYPESLTYFFGLKTTLVDERLQKTEKSSDGVFVLNMDKAVQDFGATLQKLDSLPVDESQMNAKVAHVMRYQLPDEVFDGPRPKYAKLKPSASPPKQLAPRSAPLPTPAPGIEPAIYKKTHF